MSVFSKTLDELMTSFDMSNETLGEIVGVNRTTVSRWRSGERSPKIEKLPEIAKVFNVDARIFVGELSMQNKIETIYNQLEQSRQAKVYNFAVEELEEQENDNNTNISELEAYRNRKRKAQKIIDFPCFGFAGAGLGEALQEEKPEYIPLPSSVIPPEADFCLLVNGDSMEPSFLNGTYVFINIVHGVHSGTVAVVILNGEGLLKRVWFENNIARLESFNKKYEDIVVTEHDDFRIVGKVVM
ncbi:MULTISPECIES: XRE family transcriptional regulator [Enterococcus]|uniref:XRE family transcriptional regulator n=1 Tax=Enterococcus TaxID=1350 RepID=UPI000450EC77|nr:MULTISPECIES: XRE family transcriptional regulator [Enterococcus]EYT96303.1 peptidase S24 [Enterococcus mundtii CRL35]